jgi:hypothetical protein
MAGTLTGGLRDRMLLESIFRGIQADLQAKGWFDANDNYDPIQMIDEYPDEEGEVPLNTLAISMGETYGRSVELGSNATERTIPIYCDFFAQSDGLGRHVIGDILSWVESNPSIPVYDYDQATPSVDFYVQYDEETAETRKPTRAVNPWQKHWHVCEFRVRDERAND